VASAASQERIRYHTLYGGRGSGRLARNTYMPSVNVKNAVGHTRRYPPENENSFCVHFNCERIPK